MAEDLRTRIADTLHAMGCGCMEIMDQDYAAADATLVEVRAALLAVADEYAVIEGAPDIVRDLADRVAPEPSGAKR